MNNQFQDPNQAAATPPQQPAWPPTMSDQSAPPVGDNIVPTVQTTMSQEPNQPLAMETPGSGKKTWILVAVLVILVILGFLILASFQGWISLGGIEKIWGGGSDTSTTATTNNTTVPTTPTYPNDTTRKTDLANLKTALKKYYQANQTYPTAAVIQKTSDANNALTTLAPTFIAQIPVDPMSPTNYYGYKSDGKTFELTSILEDRTDPAGIQTGNFFIYKVTDTSVETPTASSAGSGTTTTTPTTPTTTTTPTPSTSIE